MNLPEAFQSNISQILGEELPDFLAALDQSAPTSVRLNPKKKSALPALAIEESVLWAKDGRYLLNRPVFTEDPAFHAGAYGVQDASAMFLGYVLE